MKKFLCIALALFIMLACFAACGQADPAESTDPTGDNGEVTGDAIKIGGIGPLTGTNAVYGAAAKQGAEIAVEEVNALGGIQFELNFQDDEADAEKSVNAYNNLKDWGMQILSGSVTTGACIAVSSECFSDRIFALTPSASSLKVVEGKDNVFQMCFSDPNQGIASAQYISENKLATKVAVIYNNGDAYSTGIYEKFASEAETKGLDIVSVTTFTDDSQNDFSVQLADAQNAGAELIFLPIYYTPASLILNQANSMGYEPLFFGVDGMDGILTLEGFDIALAEGVMLLTPFAADATDDATVAFVEKYNEKYGETPNQFAADGYDCIYALYKACTAAGITADMDASAICDKLIDAFVTETDEDGNVTKEGLAFEGLTGAGDSMTWAKTGEVSKAPKAVVIKDGVYVGM